MQRRAAAAYIVLFLVLAAGAYATLATAQAPSITIGDPAATLENGDTITAGDREYTLTAIETSESGGGGHGGGESTIEATFAWTNETARYTETWSSGDAVDYGNATYTLLLSNRTDSDGAILRGQLPEDVPTYDRDGTTYVVVNDTGDREESVPLSEYEGVDRIRLSVGDPIRYDGNDATVESVTTDSMTVTWRAPETTEVSVGQHGNVTLNDETYLAHFPSENRVELTQDFRAFQAQQHRIDRFHERMNGLRGAIILSAVAIVLLAALAFLPVRE